MGISVSVKFIFDNVGFDDQHMVLIVVIRSLMVFDEHKDNTSFRWIQRRHTFLVMGKCWWLLLVVAYDSSVCTCTLEDNNKGIDIDIHMEFGVHICSTIILYEHNSDEISDEDFCCRLGLFLLLPLCNCHSGGQITTTHYFFCYFIV